MAYSTSNPPSKVVSDIGNQGPQLWTYKSADAVATVATAGYITNGLALGMKVNDIVEVLDTATPLVTTHRVSTVSSTYPGVTNLSAAVTIGNT